MKGFIIGALCGAGIGLLYAPATGARTRSLLRDKANKTVNDVTEFADKKRRHIANKMEGYKAKMHNVVDDIQSMYTPTTERTGEAVGTGSV